MTRPVLVGLAVFLFVVVAIVPASATAAVGAASNQNDAAGADTETTQPAASNVEMLILVGMLVVVIGLVGAAVWQSGAFSRRRSMRDGATGETTDPNSAEGDPSSIPDEELLSDSDRVIKLLEDNGGRMKQVNIVEETDWSKSKVSMLLTDMEEDGAISKLRVGRENIISLSGHEPDAAGSPFDE